MSAAFRVLVVLAIMFVTAGSMVQAAGPEAATFEKAVARGVNFLKTRGQAEDGSYSKQTGVGITALITTSLLRNGRTAEDPAVARSLAYIDSFVQPDGGVYKPGTFHRNYETSLTVMCWAEANADGRYTAKIKAAEKFLKTIQWDEDEDADKGNFNYGGQGYGSKKRPDLSNTAYFIDALRAAGAAADDPAIQKALVFVSRSQNLESEFNTAPHAPKNPDGGFYYTPAGDGESQAGKLENGGLRSYASMTYHGLKSMIYAGVGPNDPRVKAATEWLKKNYDVSSNPGLGQTGVFYYFHTFAKTLSTMGFDEFVDAEGKKHDWRADLVAELAKRQQADGSWTNAAERWLEADPNLATGYALLALSYCKPQPAKPSK